MMKLCMYVHIKGRDEHKMKKETKKKKKKNASLTLFVRYYQVFSRHEIVFEYVRRETLAKARLRFELVVQGAVVVVGVGEDAVYPPGYRAEALRGRLLDGDATREVLVAVEEGGRDVESVEGVVQGRALLGIAVGGAEEDPLLRGGHLGTDLGVAFELETDGKRVELVTELPEVFVLPGCLVLARGHFQESVDVLVVFPNHLLNVLLT